MRWVFLLLFGCVCVAGFFGARMYRRAMASRAEVAARVDEVEVNAAVEGEGSAVAVVEVRADVEVSVVGIVGGAAVMDGGGVVRQGETHGAAYVARVHGGGVDVVLGGGVHRLLVGFEADGAFPSFVDEAGTVWSARVRANRVDDVGAVRSADGSGIRRPVVGSGGDT